MKKKEIRFIVTILIVIFVVILFQGASSRSTTPSSQSASVFSGIVDSVNNLFRGRGNSGGTNRASTSFQMCLHDDYHTCGNRFYAGFDPEAYNPQFPDRPGNGCYNHQANEDNLDAVGKAICKTQIGQCPPNSDYRLIGAPESAIGFCQDFSCECRARAQGKQKEVVAQ